MLEHSEHQRITAAGWSCRTNNRGWVIYKNPATGLWQTRSDAISMIGALRAVPAPRGSSGSVVRVGSRPS